MRLVLAAALLLPGTAFAEAFHDLGKPEQCGGYFQTEYDRESWFTGGEGGMISLEDAQNIRGLNGVLYEGTVTEEGFADPAGRILALRGELATVEGLTGAEILVIATERGIRVLQRCP